MSLPQRFADRMGHLLGPDFPADVGVAVSGGGDSMVMLHLAAGWGRIFGIRVWPVTIDHGLRPDSVGEAALVADECRGLGLPHAVLRWQGWDGQGNLMDAARRARLDLIGRWRGVCGHVLFAHTQDDQAETVLMRLARGSGVEGLSAMAERRPVRDGAAPPLDTPGGPPRPDQFRDRWEVLRPLLHVSRAELRHYARVLKIPFVDDPTNQDPAFDRARIRRLLDQLAPEGIDRGGLAATADRMRRARYALERRAYETALGLVRQDALTDGAVALDRDGFAAVDPETQLRILAGALVHVSGAEYRPRAAPLEAALERWLSGGTAVLHGGMACALRDRLYVFREPKALEGVTAQVGETWDRRWLVAAADLRGREVRALGAAGLSQLAAEGRAPPRTVPQRLLATLPSVWDGARLVACAALGYGPTHLVHLRPPGGQFPACLNPH